MELLAAIHVPEKSSFRPAFIDVFALLSEKTSNRLSYCGGNDSEGGPKPKLKL